MSEAHPQQLEDAAADQLLAEADRLQHDGLALVRDLGLTERLGRLGRVELGGSGATGLMTHPELDLGVDAVGTGKAAVSELVRELVTDPHVTDLEYKDETSAPPPLARFFVVVGCRSRAGEDWTLDLSLWTGDEVDRSGPYGPARIERSLTPEKRSAILWIKSLWCRSADYPLVVGAVQIYDAVLDHGVRTPAEFERYLAVEGST